LRVRDSTCCCAYSWHRGGKQIERKRTQSSFVWVVQCQKQLMDKLSLLSNDVDWARDWVTRFSKMLWAIAYVQQSRLCYNSITLLFILGYDYWANAIKGYKTWKINIFESLIYLFYGIIGNGLMGFALTSTEPGFKPTTVKWLLTIWSCIVWYPICLEMTFE